MGSLLKEVERTADIRPAHRPRILAAIQPLIPPALPMPRVAQWRHAERDRRLSKSSRGRSQLRETATR